MFCITQDILQVTSLSPRHSSNPSGNKSAKVELESLDNRFLRCLHKNKKRVALMSFTLKCCEAQHVPEMYDVDGF